MTGLDIIILILAISAYMLAYDGACKVRGFDGYESGYGCVVKLKE